MSSSILSQSRQVTEVLNKGILVFCLRLTTVIQDVTVETLEKFLYFLWHRTLLFLRTMFKVSQHDNLGKTNKFTSNTILQTNEV